ncbi:hypothetical protein D5086_002903 [Populus alba]|uniref:Uncharacterized protein n=1 Tax=Populus alba TaxID=43335 RepID=A0ACC4D409_POPAL
MLDNALLRMVLPDFFYGGCQVYDRWVVGGRGGGTNLIGIVPTGISSKYFGELWELTVKATNDFIKGIGSVSDFVDHVCHLINTSGIVTNGTICINYQPSGNGARYSKGSYNNTIHSSKRETNKNVDYDSKDRNNDRFLSQCKPKNNINIGSSNLAGISNILNKAVCIVSIVLSYKSSNKSGPETNNNTQEELSILDNFLEFEIEDGKGRSI